MYGVQCTGMVEYQTVMRGGAITVPFGTNSTAHLDIASHSNQGAGLMAKRGIRIKIPGFGQRAALCSRRLRFMQFDNALFNSVFDVWHICPPFVQTLT